ncbi:hypothetical protein PIROE2DRAFT_16352 [Piromyces sp. E2]|nr:hypothetical protein PIROE2DRAFT_16352 [Piromyces sp. E2]|eukprot:OUM58388.1 hypothetical protein PIROE2DRAFT_16352 [Piromyces sp. E2]
MEGSSLNGIHFNNPYLSSLENTVKIKKIEKSSINEGQLNKNKIHSPLLENSLILNGMEGSSLNGMHLKRNNFYSSLSRISGMDGSSLSVIQLKKNNYRSSLFENSVMLNDEEKYSLDELHFKKENLSLSIINGMEGSSLDGISLKKMIFIHPSWKIQ